LGFVEAMELLCVREWDLLKGTFTPNVKSMLNENLGGILGGNPMS
jgi:hypothetical protein